MKMNKLCLNDKVTTVSGIDAVVVSVYDALHVYLDITVDTSYHRPIPSSLLTRRDQKIEFPLVEVVFFKESGKYYTQEHIPWDRAGPGCDPSYEHPVDTLQRLLKANFPDNYIGMTAVCTEVPNAFPLMTQHTRDLR